MNREEVYAAIDTEREYQDRSIANPLRPDMISDLHVGDTIAAIQYNLNKALDAWYIGSNPHIDAMIYLRKVAGLVVQAAEKYGMASR